jgi:hypothetical protein
LFDSILIGKTGDESVCYAREADERVYGGNVSRQERKRKRKRKRKRRICLIFFSFLFRIRLEEPIVLDPSKFNMLRPKEQNGKNLKNNFSFFFVFKKNNNNKKIWYRRKIGMIRAKILDIFLSFECEKQIRIKVICVAKKKQLSLIARRKNFNTLLPPSRRTYLLLF